MEKERTFTQINNDLLSKLYSSELTSAEIRVMLFIIRQTAGYHRTSHIMSSGFIAKAACLSIRTVKRVLKRLESMGFIRISFDFKLSPIHIISISTDNCNSTGEHCRCSYDENGDIQTTVDNSTDSDLSDTPSGDSSDTGGSDTSDTAYSDEYDTQINKNNKINNNKIKERNKAHVIPSFLDVCEYCSEKGYAFNTKYFYYYYKLFGYRTQKGTWKDEADEWARIGRGKINLFT